ncbi:4Fe-4S dicluster domain-containing protein [Thermodesulfobacteriota bacterium]
MAVLAIKKADLDKLASELAASGKRTVFPSAGDDGIRYRVGGGPEAVDLSDRPKNSIKEFFFPGTEKILRYRYEVNVPAIEDVEPDAPDTVILGARPCDAASLPIVELLWNWDTRDEFFNARRKNTVVVSLACREAPDEACFCTAVGLSPNAGEGSDILLHDVGDGLLACEFLTPAGEALREVFAKFGDGETDNGAVEASRQSGDASLAGKTALDKVASWLEDHFEDPLWEEKAARCIGCGTCTFLCPTCHCFDIQDESAFDSGARVKNWDACQFGLFTLHASGHNPRNTQPKRYRQRILHKYAIYPEKFGRTLCTGCGRCVAYCPVNLSLYDVVATIQERAEGEE